MTADDFAAQTVRNLGMPRSRDDLVEMLRLAFTRGEIQGALDGRLVLDRIIDRLAQGASH